MDTERKDSDGKSQGRGDQKGEDILSITESLGWYKKSAVFSVTQEVRHTVRGQTFECFPDHPNVSLASKEV